MFTVYLRITDKEGMTRYFWGSSVKVFEYLAQMAKEYGSFDFSLQTMPHDGQSASQYQRLEI